MWNEEEEVCVQRKGEESHLCHTGPIDRSFAPPKSYQFLLLLPYVRFVLRSTRASRSIRNSHALDPSSCSLFPPNTHTHISQRVILVKRDTIVSMAKMRRCTSSTKNRPNERNAAAPNSAAAGRRSRWFCVPVETGTVLPLQTDERPAIQIRPEFGNRVEMRVQLAPGRMDFGLHSNTGTGTGMPHSTVILFPGVLVMPMPMTSGPFSTDKNTRRFLSATTPPKIHCGCLFGVVVGLVGLVGSLSCWPGRQLPNKRLPVQVSFLPSLVPSLSTNCGIPYLRRLEAFADSSDTVDPLGTGDRRGVCVWLYCLVFYCGTIANNHQSNNA